MTETNIDLEKLRDEKCIPLANEIVSDMAKEMMPEDANEKVDYTGIATKIMQKFLDADTNITTENEYVFQLILGAFAGLNGAIQDTDVLPIDNKRYGKIATKVIDILANSGIEFGPTPKEKMKETYSVLLPELNKLFAEEKLTILEVKYISDAIFESFKTVQSLVGKSVEGSVKKAEEKLFGVDDMGEITMKKLDEVLKS
jgi:hypothetical protein